MAARRKGEQAKQLLATPIDGVWLIGQHDLFIYVTRGSQRLLNMDTLMGT